MTFSWSGRLSTKTQPLIYLSHQSLTYSFLLGHEFLVEAIPNTRWLTSVGSNSEACVKELDMFSVTIFDVVKNSMEIIIKREIAQNEYETFIVLVKGLVLSNDFMVKKGDKEEWSFETIDIQQGWIIE